MVISTAAQSSATSAAQRNAPPERQTSSDTVGEINMAVSRPFAKGGARETARTLFLGALLYIGLCSFVRPVHGESMAPAIRHGAFIVVVPCIFACHPAIGEIVVVTRPWASVDRAVKRVAGRSGDCMTFEGRRSSDTTLQPCTVVPSGRVYLVGDNGVSSTDSRQLGSVTEQRIAGVVLGSLW